MTPENEHVKTIATNRKARHDYVIEDTYEAGIELEGAEVKSLREGNVSIAEAYARPFGDEIYVVDMHISPYEKSTIESPDPTRKRKLLLHRGEIDRIISRCTQRGYTLVPLKLYFKNGWAKVLLGLARKREHGDKRKKKLDKQRKKEIQREMRRRQR
ncbi:MAG: SsrA-binding protein SmpB [Planctomycetes bacterium]|nr:SsrA-binding protein SmpB [Planctomycetota bacterium]